MKSFTFLTKTLVLLIFANTIGFAQSPANNKAFDKFLAQYYLEAVMMNPLSRTSLGDNRANDQLPNYASAAFRKKEHDYKVKYLRSLKAFNRKALNPSERITYDMIEMDLKDSLEAEQFHDEYIPFDQYSGLPLEFPGLGSGNSIQPFKTVKDYRNWLKRIDGFTVYADTVIGNFNKGIASGIVLPRALVLKMIPQLKAQIVTDTSENIFYKPILNMPASFSAKDKAKLRLEYQLAISNKIIPTYTKLAQYIENSYLPKARLTSGINGLPNGAARYNFIVRAFTTTDKTPEEINQIGVNEVQRITGEIETLKNKIGFKGSVADLFSYMVTAKEFFPFRSEEEILQAYRNILPQIEPNLKKLFNLRPKSAMEIMAIEKYRAGSAAANYRRGTADGVRPGVFNVPIFEPEKYNKLGMESLFVHEGIPGHHYQISLQMEDQALPKVRQLAVFSVFAEGWALYTESLGEELGLYTDPYQRLAAYQYEIWRAVRLVVDTNLHTGKMTREEAIAYMMEKTGKDDAKSTAEIERYLSNPGQALCYKIGELKIHELKAKYQKSLGSKFDIRNFHDAILKVGSVPLFAFEKYMDDWAKSEN